MTAGPYDYRRAYRISALAFAAVLTVVWFTDPPEAVASLVLVAAVVSGPFVAAVLDVVEEHRRWELLALRRRVIFGRPLSDREQHRLEKLAPHVDPEGSAAHERC